MLLSFVQAPILSSSSANFALFVLLTRTKLNSDSVLCPQWLLFNASNPFNCLRMFLWTRVVDRELRAFLFQSGHVRNFCDCYQHIWQRQLESKRSITVELPLKQGCCSQLSRHCCWTKKNWDGKAKEVHDETFAS